MHFTTLLSFIGVLLSTTLVCGLEHEALVPGGFTTTDQPAGKDIQHLVRGLYPKIRAHLLGVPGGKNIVGMFTPISYRTQLVNGINYFVKVSARTARKTVYYHLRIFKTFDGVARLIKVQGPKRPQDSITYF